MSNLASIVSQINHLKYDIRAEVLINHLLHNQVIRGNQYWVSHQGQFTRSYRSDVLGAKILDFNYDATQLIDLELSRDSLYDVLPENFTHSTQNEIPNKGVETMIQEHKIRKQQEKSARKFFSPFENEFFSVGVATETFEHQTFEALNGSEVPALFYTLWDISAEFPSYLVSKFIRLLPYAYKIVGDIPLTIEILSELLEEKVHLHDNEYEQYTDKTQEIHLGEEIILGVDSIIGIDYQDYTKHFILEIGPVEKAPFSDYILQGKRSKFIKMFCEHFFPIEVEIQIVVLPSEKDKQFKFTQEQHLVLGYNTYL